MEKEETNYVVRKIYYIAAPDPDDAILQAKEKLPDLVKCAEYRRRKSGVTGRWSDQGNMLRFNWKYSIEGGK